MTQQDLVDLKAYLDTVAPVANPVAAHALDFPFGFRPLLDGWRLLFFEPGAFEPDPSQSEAWNRGAYIVTGPGHCGECHTPRNAFGAPEQGRFLAGTRDGPDGKPVPNITPHADGIGDWSKSDIAFALQTGILPDGDVLGGAMSEVVDDDTSHLSADDRNAIADYLLSLPPLAGAPAPAEAN
jgi:mono/diheme cytochrome c family protein